MQLIDDHVTMQNIVHTIIVENETLFQTTPMLVETVANIVGSIEATMTTTHKTKDMFKKFVVKIAEVHPSFGAQPW